MQPNKLFALAAAVLVTGIVACNQQSTASTPDAAPAEKKETKAVSVVKSFYPLLEKGDWDGISKITSSDFVDHNPWAPPGGITGRDTLIKSLKDFKESFPDMKYEILDIAENGNNVYVHYHFTGSNNGMFMGMPATNKKVDYMGVDLIEVKDSMATAHWDYGDNITFGKQMGLMP
jgi:predicted ester cyclase